MTWYEAFDEKTAVLLPGLTIHREEPMSRHTSFRIGGPARRMAFPETAEQLTALVDLADREGYPYVVVGSGSNLLVADEGVDRLVVCTAAMVGLELGAEPNTIAAEAGVPLARLADFACKNGLTGLEFAHGIPGSLGGAVFMNAGAYGGEMVQVVREVSVLFPGEGVRTMTGEEMDFSYRHSLLADRPGAVALQAVMALTPGDPAVIKEKMRELIEKRRASQPLEWPSAGSAFKRPVGYFAGTLIDQCGLKGLTIGGAQVSEKHAGFVINRGGATCDDVLQLLDEVRRRVLEQTGVELEPEIRAFR